jgi:hypothetical protein
MVSVRGSRRVCEKRVIYSIMTRWSGEGSRMERGNDEGDNTKEIIHAGR